MNVISAETTFHGTPLESIFKTSKKTIQEYVREIDRHCRYKSIQSQVTRGVVLDDRGCFAKDPCQFLFIQRFHQKMQRMAFK